MYIHQHFITAIEAFAPLKYQESYDNSGWQCGYKTDTTTGILLCLDVTEAVVEEAIERKCNLIIAHHPVIFPQIKKITNDQWIGRVLLKAIEHRISIYTAHTNLDNMKQGVNAKFAQKIGLNNLSILSPIKHDLVKYIVYVPLTHKEMVMQAVFEAGAGQIGEYAECSFSQEGKGTFKPSENTDPTIGQAGGPREEVAECKLEFICPQHLITSVIQAVKKAHPYEEVAYDLIRLENLHQEVGAGMVGELLQPMSQEDFFTHLQQALQVSALKYTHAHNKEIRKVAICGGSGSFLIQSALAQGCDAYVTSDIKYHQFFDAEDKMTLVDIGHYETEQYTSEIFYDILKDKFPNFVVCISKINTNPIKYFS